jgi:hypothetical protein
MEPLTEEDRAGVEEVVSAIARSPIVVPRPAMLLPAGFDAIDVAILNWIAAEARQLRSVALM